MPFGPFVAGGADARYGSRLNRMLQPDEPPTTLEVVVVGQWPNVLRQDAEGRPVDERDGHEARQLTVVDEPTRMTQVKAHRFIFIATELDGVSDVESR